MPVQLSFSPEIDSKQAAAGVGPAYNSSAIGPLSAARVRGATLFQQRAEKGSVAFEPLPIVAVLSPSIATAGRLFFIEQR
jgi:hypothetical protein